MVLPMRFIYIFGQHILLDDDDAMTGNLILQSKSVCCIVCALKEGLGSVTTAQQKAREMSLGGTNIVCGNSIPPPPLGVLHHMNELMLLISLQRVLRVCGKQPQARIYKPSRYFSTETDNCFQSQQQSSTVPAVGLCQHAIFLFGSLYCTSFSLRAHNKVVNGGEELHFTLRLNPNPPNPSSFYASQEPILNWPTVALSRLFECLPLSLSLSHTSSLKLKSEPSVPLAPLAADGSCRFLGKTQKISRNRSLRQPHCFGRPCGSFWI